MEFPLSVTYEINIKEKYSLELEIRSPLTFIIGPNGSGKTLLLKSLKNSLEMKYKDKTIRFISSGRLSPLEQYRSKCSTVYYDKDTPDQAQHGDKYFSKERHKIESINGDLHTLSVRQDILIKVRERLQKLFKRNIIIDWDSGQLKVSFYRLGEENSSYSSGREASGLLHLIGLLAALYDDDVGILLIDEPEISLHPQLQAFLLKEILRVTREPNENSYQKIIIIATHSAEMIKISKTDDLLSFIFCDDLRKGANQIPNNAGELKNKNIQSLIARLGHEHKLALFSRTPLLVEGSSDVIICNTLSDKLYLNIEAAGSQILPVNGKEIMSDTIKLFRLMGKSPTILVDADAFADNLNLVKAYFNNEKVKNEADNLASQLGQSSILNMADSIYEDFCKLVDDDWKSIESVATQHSYFTASGNEVLKKRRSALCTVFSEQNLNNEWNKLKARLGALFDIFEKTGLFILRKGNIECYYQCNHQKKNKIEDAVIESEYILESEDKELENSSYQEILNCLKYASNSEMIDESILIRDELLSIISPVFAHYQVGENILPFPNKPSFFDYEVSEEGKLKIEINSKVLDVRKEPIILDKNDHDIIGIINKALGIVR
ncbi:ATP-dependent endonuclease [Gallibacterium melopsittaci]|uniref:ATP-dependent endonuclease n=1 Tax=Gallibacterium melopsittaci TaxID=516063 RepID=A0ABV6HXU3_9PAST